MKITTDQVKQKTLYYKSSFDKYAFITITEWANLEGYDITSSHGKGRPLQFSMGSEEIQAFMSLFAGFDLVGEE